jgi:GR25 family glycosyltransferase involved in LPS biosynthesis
VDVAVLFINVKGHTARLDFMSEQLGKVGERAKAVVRIDGVRVTQADIDSKKYGDYPFAGGTSELGCTLSHLAAARHIVENDLPMALVIEDDVSFALSHRWPCKLTQMLPPPVTDKKSPNQWTAIQLGYIDMIDGTNELTSNDHPGLEETGFVIESGYRSGAYGYVLSQLGARQLLAATRNGTYLGRAAIGTDHGVADEVVFGFRGANTLRIWPRLLFPQNAAKGLGSTIHDASSGAHVKWALTTIKVAVTTWLHWAESYGEWAGSKTALAQQAMCKLQVRRSRYGEPLESRWSAVREPSGSR